MNVLLTGVLALTMAACSGPAPDTTLVISSDPDLRDRVAQLLPVLADKAGMDLDHPIRAERRSREELEGYLLYKLDQELPEEEAMLRTRSYQLLGLVDEGFDLRKILLSVYTEQVAGFYDPDSTALFVMDDMPVETLETVLVHELVHAVQDQTADLDSLTAKSRGNDHQVAAQSAIEGHATLIMLEYMAEELRGEPMDLTELPDFSQAVRPALEAMRQQYPALASAPVIIQESLLFPYIEGASFLAAFWQQVDGRPPPFGRFLPQSTEQILHPERAPGMEEDPPTDLTLAATGDSKVVYENTLGQLEVGIFLDELLGKGHRDLADGWDGDALALMEGPGGDDGLFWVSVWDSREQRDRFLDAVREEVEHLPLGGAMEESQAVGMPAAILRVGVAQGVEMQIGGGGLR